VCSGFEGLLAMDAGFGIALYERNPYF